MDPQPVTTDDFREALRRLLIGFKTHTRDGIEIPTSRQVVIRLVYPWVAQVHRLGEAFLQLEKRGYTHEGHAMVRSALEHALMAHWVAVTGDAGVTARYAEDHRLLQNLLAEARGRPRDVATSNWDLDLLQELVDAREPAGADEEKVQQKVQQVCERLGLISTLYAAYRVHSWLAHPTTFTAGVYLIELDDGRLALQDNPVDPSPGATLSMMTHCVYWARRVLDDLMVGKPYEEWLDEIAASIEVVPRLPEPPS